MVCCLYFSVPFTDEERDIISLAHVSDVVLIRYFQTPATVWKRFELYFQTPFTDTVFNATCRLPLLSGYVSGNFCKSPGTLRNEGKKIDLVERILFLAISSYYFSFRGW